MTEMPCPSTLRWQPQRLGLTDLFYYDEEVIPFKDGRLLLRGNNGTGKSKVLALTLPFLLDADLSPSRLEPDADPKKRMEWNLLLDGEHPHQERLGYTWLEFGRVDEEGRLHFFTLGAGLKAVSGRGMARHWFFVTAQRVGSELHLFDSSRTALSRERLVEALGDRGRVFDTKADYRRAVDETLFGLGERRYEALVNLLVQLRQPQLSKRPNERALSDALTEALSPVRENLIEYVAEGFRGLDDERLQLEELFDATRAAEAFLEHYREYARVISRRKAEGPRLSQSRYESLGRELLRIGEELKKARSTATTFGEKVEVLRRQEIALEAEYEALMEGEHADGEVQLRTALKAMKGAEARATDAARLRGVAEDDLGRAKAALEDALTQQERQAADLDEARRKAAATAEAAHMRREHAELLGVRPNHWAQLANGAAVAPAEARHRADEAFVRKRRDIARVRELIVENDSANQALKLALDRLDEATSAHDEAIASLSESESDRELASSHLVEAVRLHFESLVEVRPEEPGAVIADLGLWASTLDGANPAAAALSLAAELARSELSAATAQATRLAEELNSRERELDEEIGALEDGRTEPPPQRYTRRTHDLPGIPLWRAVDFEPGVSSEERSGLEAALEAAGLLDAHVLPGGVLRAPTDGEVLLAPDEAASAGRGPASSASQTDLTTLLRVTLPNGEFSVRAEDVAAVLSSIGVVHSDEDQSPQVEQAPCWVSPDGRFRLGVATGGWSKREATYIGEAAREAARLRRLDEARNELAEVESERLDVENELERLRQRWTRVRDERDRLPADDKLRDAHAEVAAKRRAADKAAALQAQMSDDVEAKQALARQPAEELAETGSLLDLPTDQAELEHIVDAVNDYASALQQLWYGVRLATLEEQRLEKARDDSVRAGKRHAEAVNAKRTSDEEFEAAAVRFRILDSTIGAEVREFQRRREDVANRRKSTREELETAQGELTNAKTAAATAEATEESYRQQQQTVAKERDLAIAALRRTAALHLVSIALPGKEVPDPAAEWPINKAVALARLIEQELAAVNSDDSAWSRAQARLSTEFTTLQSALGRHGHTAVGEPSDDGYSVTVVFGGKATPVADLVTTLREDTTARERLLSAREREIIENHLVTEVGANLADLVSEAEEQLHDINAELSERPTSTGMKLRVVWRPLRDGPPGLSDARRRLLQLSDAWNEEDRQAIGAFLQARIAEVREADDTGTWYEQLERALDYRAWHQFTVERYQNGSWRPATGPASGGERVLAVSVPLFAAASSHYRSAANPHAARLVVLDEAFAGVDDDSRAKSLGLLAAFDLDIAMTSEREWGCYPEVPGLSIAQLSRVEGIPAVLVSLWEWDGKSRTAVEHPISEESAETGLWV